MTKFGGKVTARMKEMHMDQKTLAGLANIPTSSLNRYILTTEPRIDVIMRVAAALEVEPSYFTDSFNAAVGAYNEVVSLVTRSRKALTIEEKQKIIAVLLSED
ncbi:MAG: helix-turn-helix domain-containing protein [Bacilli bacterium]|nr:helix-turn-helix domain-containing protein [Bacilli bacterium]